MSTLTAHLDDDLLSAYVDGELPERRVAEAEDHLAHCPSCKARLDGLARVVGRLHRLERAAPPPLLAERVARHVALVDRERSLVERLEARLNVGSLDSPIVLAFAVVLALAVIAYAFTAAVERSGDGGTRFGLAEPESAAGLVASVEVTEIAGHELVRQDGVWIEVMALDASWEPVAHERVAADGEAGRELLERQPWAAELIAGGAAGVVLRDGERWVGVYR